MLGCGGKVRQEQPLSQQPAFIFPFVFTERHTYMHSRSVSLSPQRSRSLSQKEYIRCRRKIYPTLKSKTDCVGNDTCARLLQTTVLFDLSLIVAHRLLIECRHTCMQPITLAPPIPLVVAKELQKVQKLQSVQNVQKLQKLQKLHNVKKVRKVHRVHQIQKVQNIHRVHHVHKV